MCIRERFELCGITAEMLDSMVHDVASGMATNANNSGMKSQIEFLKQAGFDDDSIWARLLITMLKPDQTVDVSEPKHFDSPHTCAFRGTVHKVMGDFVRVRDMEDNHWDIEFDEILSFEDDD